jgi:hypothetical protein
VTPLGIPELLEGIPGLVSGIAQMWTSNVSWFLVVPMLLGAGAALFSPRNAEVRALAWSYVLGMVLVLLVSRAIPPVRTLVIVLPVIIGISVAGLVGLLPSDRTAPLRAVVAGIVVIGIGLTSLAIFSVDDRPLSETPHEFWDAEQVTLDLAPLLTDDASVIAYKTPTSPLRYYFQLHGLPVRALGANDRDSGPVYLIVETGQTLQDVIDGTGVSDRVDASRASELKEYETGSLWLVPDDESNT